MEYSEGMRGEPGDGEKVPWTVGQIIRQRVGLHHTEDSRLEIVRITPTSVQARPVSRGRGRRLNGKVFSIAIARVNATMEPVNPE